jgi:hypothetical protein
VRQVELFTPITRNQLGVFLFLVYKWLLIFFWIILPVLLLLDPVVFTSLAIMVAGLSGVYTALIKIFKTSKVTSAILPKEIYERLPARKLVILTIPLMTVFTTGVMYIVSLVDNDRLVLFSLSTLSP